METSDLTITINLENAAFEEPGPELERILHKLADTLADFNKERDSHDFPLSIRDSNGNTVGEVRTKGVGRTCQACGLGIPGEIAGGDHCPACGAEWEKQRA